MTALPRIADPDLRRLIGVASRMASPHDGEALNATRMTLRQLDERGVRIGDVITVAFTQPPAPRPEPVHATREHHRHAFLCLASDVRWSDAERGFLEQMAAQLRTPSPKQTAWLADLVRRARIAGERA